MDDELEKAFSLVTKHFATVDVSNKRAIKGSGRAKQKVTVSMLPDDVDDLETALSLIGLSQRQPFLEKVIVETVKQIIRTHKTQDITPIPK